MKTKSAKAKARALQNLVKKMIEETFQVSCRVRIMGEQGDDVYPDGWSWNIYVECKNREKLSPWRDLKDTARKAGDKFPVLVIKRNREKPVVVMYLHNWLELLIKGVSPYEDNNGDHEIRTKVCEESHSRSTS